MKNLKPFVFFAACLVLCYFTGAFVAASFDISTWEVPLRAFVGVGGLFSSTIATSMYNLDDR